MNGLTTLLKQHQENVQAEAARVEEAKQEHLKNVIAELRQLLGDLADEFVFDDSRDVEYYQQGTSVRSVRIPMRFANWDPDIHCFVAVYNAHFSNPWHFAAYKPGYGVIEQSRVAITGELYPELLGFLAACQAEYGEYLDRHQAMAEKQRRGRVETLHILLGQAYENNPWYRVTELPKIAEAALNELLQIVPEQSERWHKLYADWQIHHAEEVARVEEEQAIERELEANKESFREAWGIYEAARLETMERNRESLKGIQEEYRRVFHTRTLTYALVATNEDEERCLDTREAEVDEESLSPGCWLVISRSGPTEVLTFFHPVSLSDVHVRQVEAHAPYTWEIWIPEAAASLRVHFDADAKAVEKAVRSRLTALPEPPKLEEFGLGGLERWEVEQLRG